MSIRSLEPHVLSFPRDSQTTKIAVLNEKSLKTSSSTRSYNQDHAEPVMEDRKPCSGAWCTRQPGPAPGGGFGELTPGKTTPARQMRIVNLGDKTICGSQAKLSLHLRRQNQ